MEKIKGFFARIGRSVRGWFDRSKADNSPPDIVSQDLETTKPKLDYTRIIVIVLAIIVAVFLIAGSVFAIGIYKYDWDNQPAEIAKKTFPFPVAMVGLKSITINQVEQEADRLNYFFDKTEQTAQAPEESVMKNQILERLIENQVITNLSKKYDISVKGDEVDEQYQTIADQNGGKDKLETLLQDLYNLTPAGFKDLILRQLKMEKLKQKFDNELRKEVKASHILIKVSSGASKKELAKAKKEADEIYKKSIKNDADFAKLAKKYSQDKASKDDGGQLPWFGQGDMVENFEKTAFDMDIGQISKPVKTQYGYHIIKLENKRGEIDNNFTDWITEMKEKWFVHKFIQW